MESSMIHAQMPERPQLFFHVRDMTSGVSAGIVMNALKALDDRATVRIDIPMRRVEIEPTNSEPSAYRDAMNRAGYASIRQWPSEFAYL